MPSQDLILYELLYVRPLTLTLTCIVPPTVYEYESVVKLKEGDVELLPPPVLEFPPDDELPPPVLAETRIIFDFVLLLLEDV